MVKLDRDGVIGVVDTMFIFIRDSAEFSGEGSFPNRRILMDAVLIGLKNIFAYQEEYTVDISNRDSIKIFAFAIPQLNKSIGLLRTSGFHMSDETSYRACMNFIATTYKDYVSFETHQDMKNTCRILNELARSGNELAGYTYLKGVQETCSCIASKAAN